MITSNNVTTRMSFHCQMSIAVLALIFAAGCSSARTLKPDEVPKDEGAFFGNMVIRIDGRNVTSQCYVSFRDSSDNLIRNVSMDRTGWIFSTGKLGDVYLYAIHCSGSGATTVSWVGKNQKFRLSSSGKISYFGHLEVEMNGPSTAAAVAGFLGGGMVAGAVSGSNAEKAKEDAGNGLDAESRLDEATKVYRKIYGEKARFLEIVDSTIKKPDTPKK